MTAFNAVRFRVKLTDGFNTARRCTCSYCRMRGAVAVSADVGQIRFDAGEDALQVLVGRVRRVEGAQVLVAGADGAAERSSVAEVAEGARTEDAQARWDRANVHELTGTYGEYLLSKVSKVFPELTSEL